MFVMRAQIFSGAMSLALFSSSVFAVVNHDFRDSYIVVLKNNTSESRASDIAREVAKGQGVVGHQYNYALKGFSLKVPEQALKGLKNRFSEIDYIEPDIVMHALPRGGKPGKGGGGGDVERAPQHIPWGVTRVNGGTVDMSNSSAVAWVVDSGIDSSHPDLNVNKSRGANFTRGKKTNTNDGNGHGTHVAGTIGAYDDGFDVVGVAPGVEVIPVRVLDNSGSGSMSGVIAGVDHVARYGASGDCANMSLGGSGYSAALDSAIKTAAAQGIFFSIAAGNSTQDASGFTPASTNGTNIFTISAFGETNDNFAYFSNYGADVDYAQPGVDVLSTKVGGGTVSYNGTSMAAPHFCGVLLATGGSFSLDGVVSNDPDGAPDPIAVSN
ncbi:S8 family serine peptidase [Vibrio sp. SNU_ST1]|uniref:S8 family serine peptidase n=1 Tax=Vibrio sp. SNU_ST1 TaxID=3064001 RepID=UPI002729F205|nr:S8 family serine peptidase [Vibrio sp. SNU_ST1]WKY58831.1 S8 family serine peptidase [Vibrio sp. SNU_ST1]